MTFYCKYCGGELLSDNIPEVLELVGRLALWCINRAEHGDIDAQTLADNIHSRVKELIADGWVE